MLKSRHSHRMLCALCLCTGSSTGVPGYENTWAVLKLQNCLWNVSLGTTAHNSTWCHTEMSSRALPQWILGKIVCHSLIFIAGKQIIKSMSKQHQWTLIWRTFTSSPEEFVPYWVRDRSYDISSQHIIGKKKNKPKRVWKIHLLLNIYFQVKKYSYFRNLNEIASVHHYQCVDAL